MKRPFNEFDALLDKTEGNNQEDWIESEEERFGYESHKESQASFEEWKRLREFRKPLEKWFRLVVFRCFLPVGFTSGIGMMLGWFLVPLEKQDLSAWPLWLDALLVAWAVCIFGTLVFTFVYLFVDWRFRKHFAKRHL